MENLVRRLKTRPWDVQHFFLSQDWAKIMSTVHQKKGKREEDSWRCALPWPMHTQSHTHTHAIAIFPGSTRGLRGAAKLERRPASRGEGGRGGDAWNNNSKKRKKKKRKCTILTGEDNSKRKHGSFYVPPLMSRGFTHSIGTACCVVLLTAPLLRWQQPLRHSPWLIPWGSLCTRQHVAPLKMLS